MTGWERDEIRAAREHAERHELVDLLAERDRADDGARAEREADDGS